MNRQAGFWHIFLGGPASEMLGAFAIGVLVVAVGGNLLYDLLMGATLHWRTVGTTLLASVLMTAGAYGLYRRGQRRTRVEVAVDESQQAPARRGLIWLFGPNYAHVLNALAHHQAGGGGEHCWLIMQDTPIIQDAFQRCTAALVEADLSARLYPVYIRNLDAQAAYRAVRTIVRRELEEVGLAPDDVIADITSGTKPLTAGMVLAALTGGVALEYVQSQRDAQGQVIDGTQQVTLLDMDFYLAPDRLSSDKDQRKASKP